MPTMTYPTTVSEQTYIEVTGGVDTHKDTHTAAALDASGRLLGHREFAATAAGYAALLAWLGTLGQLVRVGVEGSGVYGAGLARFLQAAGVELVEIDRPDRKTRRWQGKSDPVDAEAAARAAQAGRAGGVPKTRGGKVDALRAAPAVAVGRATGLCGIRRAGATTRRTSGNGVRGLDREGVRLGPSATVVPDGRTRRARHS
jgi:transposase